MSGWEDFLSSLCKPERQFIVERMTRTFVNELVVSYLKRTRYTSHIVLMDDMTNELADKVARILARQLLPT